MLRHSSLLIRLCDAEFAALAGAANGAAANAAAITLATKRFIRTLYSYVAHVPLRAAAPIRSNTSLKRRRRLRDALDAGVVLGETRQRMLDRSGAIHHHRRRPLPSIRRCHPDRTDRPTRDKANW